MNSFVLHLTSVDGVSHIQGCIIKFVLINNVLSYGPSMVPKSFSSIFEAKFELLTALNQ